MLIHLRYLPMKSKYRDMGKEDVIQTFNPYQQYGASEKRFRNYINMILANKFNTVRGKRIKNPVCRAGNLSLTTVDCSEDGVSLYGEANDEYVYNHSEYLAKAINKAERANGDAVFIEDFSAFIKDKDAIAYTVFVSSLGSTSSDVMRGFCRDCMSLATTLEIQQGVHENHKVGLTQQEYNQIRSRLRQLAAAFESGKMPPKFRKVLLETENA